MSRRFDDQPETDAEARFFDLRDSGYTGPIDQDGHRVDDLEEPATVPFGEKFALRDRAGTQAVGIANDLLHTPIIAGQAQFRTSLKAHRRLSNAMSRTSATPELHSDPSPWLKPGGSSEISR